MGTVHAAKARRSADLRRQNSVDVLRLLRSRGRMSRAELTAQTTLTTQALAMILNDLVESGHVVEVSTREVQRGPGRPALRYEYNPHRFSVVVLYIGLRYCEVSLCDGLGRRIADNVELEPGWDVDRVVSESADVIERLRRDAEVEDRPCHVGVVVHSEVDATTESVRNVEMGWDDVPLAALLSARIGASVTVHDASRAAAIAESREGAAAGASRAVVLNTGPHLIATQVVDGVVDFGATGLAGVIGQARIPDGDAHRLIEEQVGSFAIKRRYHERTGERIDWTYDVITRARTGDAVAESLIFEYLDAIAYASMWLLTVTNPDRFVLTGVAGDWTERWRARLHSSIVELTDPRLLERCSVRFTELGRQAWVRGGVHAVLDLVHADEGMGL